MTVTATVAAQDSTSHTAIDEAIADLRANIGRLTSLTIDQRIELAQQCADRVIDVARPWVEAAWQCKQLSEHDPARAEDVATGPVSVLRYLRLLLGTLRDIRDTGQPRLPGRPREVRGQWRVPVFPTNLLFDSAVFRGLQAETWLEPGVQADELFGQNVARLTGRDMSPPPVIVVLGAGNVSAIPATDALTKILQENSPVLLKMNPVNDYLGPHFEQALSPLIDRGFLRIVYGAADVGRYVVEHSDIDEVHVTGSIETHDAIVWGADATERDARRASGERILHKPITSELGNVSGWAVVPGNYSERELVSQAENFVASITNNASFNCIASKVLITWDAWPQRRKFLDQVAATLKNVPPRFAYYPGAGRRFEEFSGQPADAGGRLPWTLLEDVDPVAAPQLFQRESFVCVCAETSLSAASPTEFLSRVIEFMNESLWGTLAATLTVPDDFARRHAEEFDQAVAALRYGTVGINQWPGLAYAWMSPPWGGFPGTDVHDAQSGIGWVHNTYLLDRPEKTVLTAPLTMFPKPLWFTTHRHPESVAWKLFDLYRNPSIWRIPPLMMTALSG